MTISSTAVSRAIGIALAFFFGPSFEEAYARRAPRPGHAHSRHGDHDARQVPHPDRGRPAVRALHSGHGSDADHANDVLEAIYTLGFAGRRAVLPAVSSLLALAAVGAALALWSIR